MSGKLLFIYPIVLKPAIDTRKAVAGAPGVKSKELSSKVI